MRKWISLALFIIIAGCLLSACEIGGDTPVLMNKKDVVKSLEIVKKVLDDNQFMVSDYIIYEDRTDFQFILQVLDGTIQYNEKSKSITKYYQDGKVYIIENGEKKEATDFSFDTYKTRIDNIYGLIRTIILSYDADHFSGYSWPGIIHILQPDPDQAYIFCQINEEDIAKLGLDPQYNNLYLQIMINRYKNEIQDFQINASSDNNSGKTEIYFGDLDFSLVMPSGDE
jgi:hypothetical protein